MELQNSNGLITRSSHHSVDGVVESLSAILKAKEITLFALIDHSGEAAKVGLSMRPTKLLIFGDPRAGTPLMQSSATSAIDLPLKVLVWQDQNGETQVTYNSPAYLGARHKLSDDLLKSISGIEGLVAKAAQ